MKQDSMPLDPSMDPGRLRHVVVLRLDRRLGNQVMLFPLLDALQEGLPRARVEVVAPGPYHAAHLGRPGRLRVTRFERSRPWLREGLATLLRLRGEHPDLVIEAGHHHQPSTSGALVTRLLGAPYRLGFRRGTASHLNLPVNPNPEVRIPRAERYFCLARAVLPTAVYAPPRWHVSGSEREAAGVAWRNVGMEGPCIALHAGGRGVRRWDPARLARVARDLQSTGLPVVVFLGPGERAEGAFWEESLGPGGRVVEAPALRVFAAMLERARLWVSADTGPLHVAAAMGVPSVGVVQHAEGLEAISPRAPYRVVYREGGPAEGEVVRAARDLLAGAGE